MDLKNDMELKITSTKEVRLSARDVREMIANGLSDRLGVEIKADDVKLEVSQGDAGGYGSMGDPSHVWIAPIPAAFRGASVKIVTED